MEVVLRVVDVPPVHLRMAGWAAGRLDLYPGAEHEVMMEQPAHRNRFFDAADALFSGIPALSLSPTGDLLMADTGNHAIRKWATSGPVSTFAGGQSPAPAPSVTVHYADGVGPAARFFYPTAVAADASGNTYVADTANHLVRKIDSTGAVTTIAGKPGVCGNADGPSQGSTLCAPREIRLDSAGNLYVGQGSYAYPKIRQITPAGVTSTLPMELPEPERAYKSGAMEDMAAAAAPHDAVARATLLMAGVPEATYRMALAALAGSSAFFMGAAPACEAAWALKATAAKAARMKALRVLFIGIVQ